MSDDAKPLPLYEAECRALESAAKNLDAEAATWADGFAVKLNGVLQWDSENEWAHVRYVKLVNSAASLRGIVARVKRKAAKT